ncbi:MAG: hypothetical protein KatS3mg103_0745 [Phycisphaerales bacterium]|nr:MAG: hypothetical protein KatS3mg103_0745 [Phycisphaerales bacterium]
MRPAQAVLVLCDGDLPAMVALSLAQDAAGQASAVGVLSAPVVPSGSALVAERIEALAESQSVRCLEFSAVSPAAVSTGHRRSRYLLEAVHQAVSNGYGSLVCPWQAEGFDPAADRRPDALPDVDALARELDRTLLVSRLATLDAPEHGAAVFEVQAPLMDLSDEQVAELALDLDVPIWRAWWWSLAEAQRPKDAALAELARACRSRWCSALERLGWSAQAEAAAAR